MTNGLAVKQFHKRHVVADNEAMRLYPKGVGRLEAKETSCFGKTTGQHYVRLLDLKRSCTHARVLVRL